MIKNVFPASPPVVGDVPYEAGLLGEGQQAALHARHLAGNVNGFIRFLGWFIISINIGSIISSSFIRVSSDISATCAQGSMNSPAFRRQVYTKKSKLFPLSIHGGNRWSCRPGRQDSPNWQLIRKCLAQLELLKGEKKFNAL